MFACELLGSGGSGGDAAIATAGTTQILATQSITTHQNNGARSGSEVSVAGEDGWGEHHYYSIGGGADMDMVHLLSFDDFLQYPADHHYYSIGGGADMDMVHLSFDAFLEYPAEELLLDAWDQSEVYCTKSGSSADWFAC
jgi:hypothetical protein